MIRGKVVYFQYSSRTEVKTPAASPGMPTAAEMQAQLQQISDGSSSGFGPSLPTGFSSSAVVSSYSGPGSSGIQPGEAPSSILLVTVNNCLLPVSIDNLAEVFRMCGEVQKIAIFIKNEVFRALIKMGSVESATNARMLLEGKDIFQDCCTLKIIYSNLPDVNIKMNGPRSRDFTAPDPSSVLSAFGFPLLPGLLPTPSLLGMPASIPLLPQAEKASGAVVLVNNLPLENFTPDHVITIFTHKANFF